MIIEVFSIPKIARLICSFFLIALFSYAPAASGKTFIYFVDPLKSASLNNFFGQLHGSYFKQDELLSDQAKSGLEIDFAAEAHAISQMPYLGDNAYLDVGSGYFTIPNTEGTALILTPSGKVLAAAFYWTSCWDCGFYASFHLTIFTRQHQNLNRTALIFEHWAEQTKFAENAEAHLDPISVDFSNAEHWGNQPIRTDIPTNVIFLTKYDNESVN